jgi:hypothetical protein
MGGMESLTVIKKEAVVLVHGTGGKWWKIFDIVKYV